MVRAEPGEIVSRLDRLARSGKLPGFAGGRDGALFSAAAHGAPFDYTLSGSATKDGEGTRVEFHLRRNLRAPLIFAIVSALTVWPGVWLTDSMLKTYFEWYRHVTTWWWYLPLAVVPLPFAWRAMARRSLASAAGHAHEIRETIASAFAPSSDAG